MLPLKVLFSRSCVFDASDREIYSVEWYVSDRCDINTIRYYTGDKILEEEKKYDDSVDDDEIGIDWSNFELIGETIIEETEEKKMNMAEE